MTKSLPLILKSSMKR